MSRTVEDKNNDTGRIFIAKNRNGADGIVFPIEMNTRNVRIRVLSHGANGAIGVVAPNVSLNPMKEERETMAQKYAKLRSKIAIKKEKEE